VLAHLAKDYGIDSLLCEGGPHLLSQMVDADLVDDLFLTISPVATGEADSPRLVEGELAQPARYELAELLLEDSELFARYRPRR
jgi:riboflavin biosynthesis pyrimidine reductase